MLAAPLLTRLYLGAADHGHGRTRDLATALAYLLLPQIFFYGIGALLGAILNSRGAFGAFAWAPVLNNVVVLAVLAVYALVPGEISLDPARMGEPKLLRARAGHHARDRRAGRRRCCPRSGGSACTSARCGAGTRGSPRRAGSPCG